MGAAKKEKRVGSSRSGLHERCRTGNRLNREEAHRQALYKAFESKDARFDGQVFVGVSSTGIYCRPVCPYMPKLDNCTFYETAAEAEKQAIALALSAVQRLLRATPLSMLTPTSLSGLRRC